MKNKVKNTTQERNLNDLRHSPTKESPQVKLVTGAPLALIV
ncbi:hypothetical protein RDI58_016541 [Solanum bulbocastanum]|uniref:Uncharacterized protein n=1 Tax=Solanum bulbocastanum TaxID=147425 RepID=A0AAN8TQF9_SOLBU